MIWKVRGGREREESERLRKNDKGREGGKIGMGGGSERQMGSVSKRERGRERM